MRNFLSRYKFGYPVTLVYMLQTVEYDAGEYLAWFHRTTNFSKVANRKKLKYTKAASALLFYIWGVIAFAWLVLGYLLLMGNLSLFIWIAVAVVTTLLAPWLLAYLLLVPVTLGKYVIQKPRIRRINRLTTNALARHKGVRIAIAGSYGKTTMKQILTTVLSAGKSVAATPGNYNTPIGIHRFVRGLSGSEDILLFEFGEYYPGDIKDLAEIVHPNVGVITGVTKQHMTRFKTIDAARDTIFELADYLGSKPLYVNAESEDARDRIVETNLTYTRKGSDGWVVENPKTSLDGTSFTARKGDKKIHVKSQLLGLHQIGPLVAAIAIANHLGMSVAEIETGLKNTAPFEHRLQPLHNIAGVTVIDDAYNGNLEGFLATIDFLHGLSAKRKVYVTPGLVETGDFNEQLHLQIGKELAAKPPDVVVLMKNSATPFIAKGMEEGNYKGDLVWQDDPLSFYNNLSSFVVKGDVVVLQNDWHDNYI